MFALYSYFFFFSILHFFFYHIAVLKRKVRFSILYFADSCHRLVRCLRVWLQPFLFSDFLPCSKAFQIPKLFSHVHLCDFVWIKCNKEATSFQKYSLFTDLLAMCNNDRKCKNGKLFIHWCSWIPLFWSYMINLWGAIKNFHHCTYKEQKPHLNSAFFFEVLPFSSHTLLSPHLHDSLEVPFWSLAGAR